METLERSRVCRLCGKHAGTAIDIFDKRGNHVKKINSVLPILVHEMDLLPKHICHPCNYKLQEFHKFYEDCRKTDASLKGQLSWMRSSAKREDIGVPMVQINNFTIKTEPPDYNDGDTAEDVFCAKNFANYAETGCTLFPETMFASSRARCTRCGFYGGKSPNDEKKHTRTSGKTRADRHIEENNNERGASRDSIRRNLFATEIFGDKNPRIQTEIPMCNIPGGMMLKNEVDGLRTVATLETLECRQNGGRVATTIQMATRTLRPRKTGAVRSPLATSAPEVPAKSRSRSRSKNTDAPESGILKSVAVKVEAPEENERSLRPRVDAIDYSDTRRKNPLAPANIRKRKRSSDNCALTAKIQRTDSNAAIRIQRTNKVEAREFVESTSFAKSRENARTTARRNTKKRAKITFADFVQSAIMAKMTTSTRDTSKSPGANVSKTKSLNQSSQTHLPATGTLKASPYLRSQRVQLRNGKLKQFESSAEKPKKIQNAERGIMLKAIKRENERSKQTLFKHRDCDICCSRFASAELYMLHECYANKRH